MQYPFHLHQRKGIASCIVAHDSYGHQATLMAMDNRARDAEKQGHKNYLVVFLMPLAIAMLYLGFRGGDDRRWLSGSVPLKMGGPLWICLYRACLSIPQPRMGNYIYPLFGPLYNTSHHQTHLT
jgi:hypothetical protein